MKEATNRECKLIMQIEFPNSLSWKPGMLKWLTKNSPNPQSVQGRWTDMIYMTVQLCDQSCKINVPKDLGSQLRDQFVFSRKPRRAMTGGTVWVEPCKRQSEAGYAQEKSQASGMGAVTAGENLKREAGRSTVKAIGNKGSHMERRKVLPCYMGQVKDGRNS